MHTKNYNLHEIFLMENACMSTKFDLQLKQKFRGNFKIILNFKFKKH